MAGIEKNANLESDVLPEVHSNIKVKNEDTLAADVNNSYADDEYPIDTWPLENQVAGHGFRDGKFTVGMLKHKNGYVLKPVNRPLQGEKEIRFYEELKKTVDPIMLQFKAFTPDYYGTTVLDMKGKDVKFLLLKDMTNGYSEPCIMDIKVGKQTWEPDAPLKKQKSEKEKYFESKQNLSFCIPGFQTYDVKTKQYYKYGKDYGKKLNVAGVYEAFSIYLNKENGVSRYILTPFLDKLREILDWFKSQRQIHIYSSSILLAYDAAVLREKFFVPDSTPRNCILNTQTTSNNGIGPDTWWCVSLIDFAHVVPAIDNTRDLNYILGLQSVIKVLEENYF